jgi:hypothetical protein
MIQEIIYTSAEKGLKQGSRGFCTVVATVGIPINLAERLESMSGYRHVFPVGDPRSTANPVACSHITTRIAGQFLHVVSRVADAGQDYTGRSNKLAHHLAFSEADCQPAGPARLLSHTGVIVERWNGEVKNIPPRQLPAVDIPQTIHLTAWHAVTGDHGWAGSVAEQLLSSQAPVNVIYPVGVNTLLLTQEVLDLIPAPQRWAVTFSTYFTRLLAGTECQLRFILDDTPEATAIRHDARARVIDLSRPVPQASGGSLVNLARTATIHVEHVKPAVAVTQETAVQSLQGTAGVSRPPHQQPVAASGTGKPGKPPRSFSTSQPALLPDLSPAHSRRGRLLTVSVIVLLLAAATTIAVVATRPDSSDAYASITDRTQDSGNPAHDAARAQRELQEKQKADREKAETDAKREAQQKAKAEEEAEKNKRDQEQAQQQEAQQRIRDEAERKDKARLAALEQKGPFALLKALVDAHDPRWSDSRGQWLFELPKPQHNQSSEQLPLRLHGQLLEISFLEAATQILPKDLPLPGIRKDDTKPDTWQLVATVGGQSAILGSYRLNRTTPATDVDAGADAQLQFTWSIEASRETEAAEIARWLPLELRVGDRKIALLQRKPESLQSEEHRPKWLSWCAGTSITQVSSTALKAIRVTEINQLNHSFYISDSGAPEQSIQLSSEPSGTDTETAPKTEHYFLLTRPLTLLNTRPDPEASEFAVGYGRLTFTALNDLSVRPEVRLLLRLPNTERFIPDLPSRAIQQKFDEIKQNPAQFTLFAGNAIGDWQDLRKRKTDLSVELQDQLKRFERSPEWWHEQIIDGQVDLPPLREFESGLRKSAAAAVQAVKKYDSVLEARVNAALRDVTAHIAKGKNPIPGNTTGAFSSLDSTPAYQNRLQDLRKNLGDIKSHHTLWTPFIPAITVYDRLTGDLVAETESGLAHINKNYEEAKRLTQLWNAAGKAEEIAVRAVIESPPIPTIDCENATSLVLIFYECQSISKAAPKTPASGNP